MKYMGSKNRIAKYLLPIILKNRKDNQCYVEPFVGGANMIDKVDGYRIGADNNEYLISMWKSLQLGWLPPKFISREEFYAIKGSKDQFTKEVVSICGTLASYNGNWFRAYGGYSCTKSGKDRNFYDEGVRNLLKQLPYIQDVEFIHSSYQDLVIPSNSIIYCDPPYDNTDKTFKDKKFNHVEFWDWCRQKSKEGHEVYISEYNAPNDFECIWSKELSITHPKQKVKSTEKLFRII